MASIGGGTNWGLLNNMASGVKESLTLYQTMAQNKRQEKMASLLQGVETDPDTGEMKLSQDKVNENRVKAIQNQRIADQADATSEVSKAQREAARGLLGEEAGSFINDNYSASDIKDNSPMLMAAMKDRSKPLDPADEALKKAQTAKLYAEIAAGKNPKKEKGQHLSAASAENLAASKTALGSLDDVEKLASNNEEMFGKGVGLLGNLSVMTGLGDTATKAASVDAALDSTAQTVGRFLEGGKLADSDINRYKKMLPQRGDKPEIVTNKLANLKRQIAQKYANDKSGYASAGYETEGFNDMEIPKGLIEGVGKDIQKKKAAASREPDVENYAKKHDISYEEALQYKQQRQSKQAGQ